MVELRVEPHLHPLLIVTDGFEEFDHQFDEILSVASTRTTLSQELAGWENRVISNTVKNSVPPWVSRKIGHTIPIVGTRRSSI